ncbi:Aminotransferase class I/classII [Trinorchestia longiramus]|nr:Aminotransferase class I/classII [Trinorchestia longiramus]
MPEMWNVYESFQALLEAGPYHLAFEGFLLVWVMWLLVAAKSRPRPIKLTKKEEEQLLAEWSPEPLLSSTPDPEHPALHTRTVKGKLGHYVDFGAGPLLNLASHDYLRLSEHKGIEAAALECLHQYGVGSCGPRGFYGTTEVHLGLEKRIAEFFKCEGSVLYSYGFSTMASAIPAYAKSGDVIFADEAVSFSIQRGLQASRSRIVYFRHNDDQHLGQLLELQAQADRKNPKKANAIRRFLVVEGLYMNTGNICRLPELIELRRKYKLRLFIDESCAFGCLGPHGRGALDYFDIPASDVDLIMGSLEYAGSSTGGYTAGTSYVIEHQRINGLGYVFSASLPPLLAAAAKQMLEVLEREAGELVPALQHRCSLLHNALAQALPHKMCVTGSVIGPIKHVAFKPTAGLTVEQQERALHKVVKEAEDRGVALVVASLLRLQETCPSPPSIRLIVNVRLSEQQITEAVTAVADACSVVAANENI